MSEIYRLQLHSLTFVDSGDERQYSTFFSKLPVTKSDIHRILIRHSSNFILSSVDTTFTHIDISVYKFSNYYPCKS